MKVKAIYPDIDGMRTKVIGPAPAIRIGFGESLVCFEDGSSKRMLTFHTGETYFVLDEETKGKLRAYLNK